MVTKKDLIITMFSAFCLTATLFMIAPTRSSPATEEYDPLADLTGPEGVPEGVINMRDIGYVCNRFMTNGTPINWTRLLEDVESLKDRVEALESQMLPQGFITAPAYDSGWFSIDKGGEHTCLHNLNTTEVLVYIIGKDPAHLTPIHQMRYGIDIEYYVNRNYFYGACWSDLTNTSIEIHRGSDDCA